METTELIKNQIEGHNLTIRTCEHVIEFNEISLDSRDLLEQVIKGCQIQIQILKLKLDTPRLSDMIYNICAPFNSASHV